MNVLITVHLSIYEFANYSARWQVLLYKEHTGRVAGLETEVAKLVRQWSAPSTRHPNPEPEG